ncbi:hypothetical protein [Streptomyces sp. NBC_01190]|uniref:hypothetical protein n=1 Tax=Streptomyces sp. NBC_01190 TaxID=2903767 RepID=UPI0038663360|nr:hypothetical protein OG519_00180 [Streptomyces sp. NBC_01190]
MLSRSHSALAVGLRSRTTTLLAAGLLAAGAVVAAGEQASAAPTTAQSCLGSAHSYTTGYDDWPSPGYATTTSNCSDINVKPNKTVAVRTCFRSTGACNAWRTISGGTWGLAATGVLNGTSFFLSFNQDNSGHVAY